MSYENIGMRPGDLQRLHILVAGDRVDALSQIVHKDSAYHIGVKWCEKLFPGVSTEYAVPWAGLRPMMPNMMPKVGFGNNPRVFYNTGHGHLGWTLSAATAELVGEAVEKARMSNDLGGSQSGKSARRA